ncbi:MAG: hypothetical protein ABIR80_15805 [Opitutaceae bacterium]
MKPFLPLPVFLAAAAALGALPFNFAAAGLLALTAAMGAVISADYSHRYRGLRLPRRQVAVRVTRTPFKAPALRTHTNRLAA